MIKNFNTQRRCILALLTVLTILAVVGAVVLPEVASANVALPTWADNTNLSGTLTDTSKGIATTISLVVGILATLGLLAGGVMFASGNADSGKRFVTGAVIGMVLAASAYGIANLFV